MNAMYSIEQVNVPPELGTIMKQYTKAVIKDKPQDLYKYSANFFAMLGGYQQIFDEHGRLTEAGGALPPNATPAQTVNTTEHVTTGTAGASEDEYMEEEAVDALFERYATPGGSSMLLADLPSFLSDLRQMLGLADSELPTAEEVVEMLQCSGDTLDLTALRQLLFENEPQ